MHVKIHNHTHTFLKFNQNIVHKLMKNSHEHKQNHTKFLQKFKECTYIDPNVQSFHEI